MAMDDITNTNYDITDINDNTTNTQMNRRGIVLTCSIVVAVSAMLNEVVASSRNNIAVKLNIDITK